jgi:putative glutamine amidotransferase
MTRPRIGITVDRDPSGRSYELRSAYVRAVAEAGGLPLLLAPAGGVTAEDYLELCDGLVISGGAFDIPPEWYGEERRAGCGPAKLDRTELEQALCQAALRAQKPVLGVCGGMQLLNVVCGGTLYQDLKADLGLNHEQPPPKDAPSHEVAVVPGTLLASLVGPGALPANSTHHQAVRQPGAGLVVSGRTDDGVVEAIELSGRPFVLGVQWHPEAVIPFEQRHAAVYRGLVAAASRS